MIFPRIAILMILLQAAGSHNTGDILIVLFLGHDFVLTDAFADDLGDEIGRGVV